MSERRSTIPTTGYGAPLRGLQGQDILLTDRAVFTEAYAVLPRGTMTDIVTSLLPGWDNTRAWIIARPLTGYAETFSQMIVEVAPGGGSTHPEPDAAAEGVLFVTHGTARLTLGGEGHDIGVGSYVYLAPGTAWSIEGTGPAPVTFHWIRKIYEVVPGLDVPDSFVTRRSAMTPVPMPGTDGAWSTIRFVDTADLRHDMHVNIVVFEPGAHIPFMETHVMEHGLYVLSGRAVYRLNRDWVEVEAGDFMWLRAFCPQACYAGGPEQFSYLLYKDVNRMPKLRVGA